MTSDRPKQLSLRGLRGSSLRLQGQPGDTPAVRIMKELDNAMLGMTEGNDRCLYIAQLARMCMHRRMHYSHVWKSPTPTDTLMYAVPLTQSVCKFGLTSHRTDRCNEEDSSDPRGGVWGDRSQPNHGCTYLLRYAQTLLPSHHPAQALVSPLCPWRKHRKFDSPPMLCVRVATL